VATDGAGRQVSTLDPFGNRTTSVYNAAGQLSPSVDAYGNHTSYVYDR
jgi:YD repeat-containing protein